MQADQLLSCPKPWQFVDRILACTPGKEIVTVKLVSGSDFFLQGHFPTHSILPGVLQMESMLQAADLLLKLSGRVPDPACSFQVSRLKTRWFRPVVPGDTVVFHVQIVEETSEAFRFAARGEVEGADTVRAAFAVQREKSDRKELHRVK